MTFDIFFYASRNGPKLTGEKIAESLTINQNCSSQKTSDGYDFLYGNQSTGVYFQMFYGVGNPEDPDGKLRFPDLELTGLTAHVNFARPTFFARESLSVIIEIANRLGCLLFDNQTTAIRKEPSRITAEELLESWASSNRWAVNAYRSKGGSVKYMTREKLDYLWEFLRTRAELQNDVGLAVFVPTQIFLLEPKTGSLVTCCSWVDHMAQASPMVDMVLIGKTRRFGGFEEKGLANFADVRRILGASLSERFDPIAHLVVNRELDADLRKQLDKVSLANTKDFKGVPLDQVVDVPP